MFIKQIRVTNFKNFKELEIEPGKVNILIGANASGKSSFISIFAFLRDIARYGLEDAISIQGGVNYLRNASIGAAENLSLRIVLQHEKFLIAGFSSEKVIVMLTSEVAYEFSLAFSETDESFTIVEDTLIVKGTFHELDVETRMVHDALGSGRRTITKVNGKIQSEFVLPAGVQLSQEEKFSSLSALTAEQIPPRTLLLKNAGIVLPSILNFLSELSVYDFDPKQAKRSVPAVGRIELEEDASNLALVLENILKEKESKRTFFNLMNDLLPFVDDVDIERFADRSILFKIKEKHCNSLFIPAFLMSDGTVNMTALIIALYFNNKEVIFIEEPERNIHPSLISKVVGMLKDASAQKQIFVTTHNPEVVRHADLDSILLVSRDEEGFAQIQRPGEKEMVRTFLKNEIGIEELYVQNLLEV